MKKLHENMHVFVNFNIKTQKHACFHVNLPTINIINKCKGSII